MYQAPMPKTEVKQLQWQAISTLHGLVQVGWTKKQLNQELRVSYQSICRWMAHPPRTKPHPALAEKILALPTAPPAPATASPPAPATAS